ncbi:MAG: outer membrane protein assembly factor BamD [Planctomycetales bacterium]|nr:outer membrane protein assembly factor BamD [Planctomycetales bacterium]
MLIRIRLIIHSSLAAFGLMAIAIGCSATGTANLPAPAGLGESQVQFRGQDEEEGDGLLGNWGPEQLYQRAKNAAGYGPDESLAKKLFDEGDEKFKEASQMEKGEARRTAFLDAAENFKDAAARWPKSSLEEDALFMLGESYFFADHYPKAAEAFDKLVTNYENTRYVNTVGTRRFAMADYWLKHQKEKPEWSLKPNFTKDDRPLFDKFGHGLRVLDRIRLQDPTGKLADDATMRAAIASFEEGHFMRADELFDDLRRSFPSSEHQFMAHLFGVKCKLKVYQGPHYSIAPMDEAELLLKQIRTQFPDQVGPHQEFLNNSYREVRRNKALHDWVMAKYYDERHEFAAASFYYKQVAEKYSDTNLAEEARGRLEQLGDEPAKPAQKLPWLARMFPSRDRDKPLVSRAADQELRR